MVFKRRDRRSLLKIIVEFFYPRGGWYRAFLYVKHRIRRLPDTPERIARGIWAGVFTTFTPFYGMHFVVAFLIARLMRGNILAALSATFFGNPLTYVPIGVISLKTGHFLLGTTFDEKRHTGFLRKFAYAGSDLKDNLIALFTNRDADWHGLMGFYHDIFYPYMIGGLIPGAVAGTIAYFLSVPLIRAYQHRRRGRIKAKFDAIKKKARAEADLGRKAD
ncbi:DUF2062 domain-containing protein [Antarcticimicrobium sediminis]|uniref:DUF2062 domain-containing protein n=1 Tax=Antarcticimicrobium sediminis TaxID=2546227 RepID=A0A4V2Z7Q5_9RHOB|nr:DUF2062 domain-containing protein [Antarcticimicrobium sediminis]TDE37396.1 DUF2062 domain-containing protein [Antarcticimicrobium sediminis]